MGNRTSSVKPNKNITHKKTNIKIPVDISVATTIDPFSENTLIRFDGFNHEPLQHNESSTRIKKNVKHSVLVHVKDSNISVFDLINKAVNQLNKSQPTVYGPHSISSIGSKKVRYSISECDYLEEKKDIIFKNGIGVVCVILPYTHNPKSAITCEHLLKSNNKLNPNNCPIYKVMKNEYLLLEENLNHIVYYTHFVDEYQQKTKCRYGEECKAYVRLKDGKDRLDDRCHVKLYRHPPRRRNIKLQQDMYSFLMDELKVELEHFDRQYRPTLKGLGITDEDYKTNNDLQNILLDMLIKEVVTNGSEKDLCKDKTIPEDQQNKEYYIMSIVKQKLNHVRHKRIGSPLYECHMLALILYTGCDCNADLCASQRAGDYKKWKIFDYCLYHAIRILDHYEIGNYRVYSGVCAVKLSKKRNGGYFVTYTSTTWKREIAQQFTGCEGMILEINKKFRSNCICCDVSWISLFDECEVLVARCPRTKYHAYSGGETDYGVQHEMLFQCFIVDESNGIQTVSVNLSENKAVYYD
eukprot:24963_1